ncbi:MAG: putative DNA binding domain-containing protein [Clostridia bacterium]|nr:putative DNA binding domain-containing protein [Clostridia bacterium]
MSGERSVVVVIESERNEFKREYTDNILKTVIAFANTAGGKILIGVDDNGTPIGINDMDGCYTKVTNAVRDSISPDVTMFTKYTLHENDKTIEIMVSEGTNKPYFLKTKGMRPEGVYIRHGASSAPASVDKIRQMIKLSEKETFESGRALNQELHFTEAAKEFSIKKIDFGKEKYVSLGIVNPDDELYTNLATLLSDECEHTIKVAIFDGNDKKTFKDRKEFTGSLFKQLRTCYEYLELCNHTAATFKGLDRIDREDYPASALREALLNALVHRDYAFSGSIMVNIFDDRIEFVSLGGLVNGLSKEDILRGVSQTRNQNLANVLYRLKHIEAYGTGIQRIFDLYAEDTVKPEIIITDNTFTMVLPNRNAENDSKKDVVSVLATQQEQLIIDYIKDNGSITDDEIQTMLEIKKSRAYVIVKSMKDKGILITKGRGNDKKHYLK